MCENSIVSLYLPIESGIYTAEVDYALSNSIYPIIRHIVDKKIVKDCFIVRYHETGPHIRIRLMSTANADCVLSTIHSLVEQEDIGVVLWDDIYEMEYEPEYERYGGVQAMRIAEEYFCRSTDYAFSVYSQMPVDSSSHKQNQAVASSLTLFAACDMSEADIVKMTNDYALSSLSNRYASHSEKVRKAMYDRISSKAVVETQTRIRELWDYLKSGGVLAADLSQLYHHSRIYWQSLVSLCNAGLVERRNGRIGADRLVFVVLPSIWHMTNNRLGVSLDDEAYNSLLLSVSFRNTD